MDSNFTSREYCSEEDANVKLFYNSLAEKTADEWYKNDILVPTIEEFLSLLPGKPRVLDLGCGPGYESMRLEARGAEVVGIDFCEENVRIARGRCPQCRFELMDFRELDSRYGKFDGVFASASLIHINPDDLNKVMNNISNVLNEGGYLLATIREGEGIKESGVTLEGGTQVRRIIYQYSRKEISKAAGNYGLKYIKDGYLDKELYKYNWQCYIFNKEEEVSGVETSEKTNFITGGLELLPLVKPLWEGLREHHGNISKDFSESVRKRSFEDRAADFENKSGNHVFRIELINVDDSQKYIGYSISSLSNGLVGELESLFIEEAYRGLHIGDLLIKNALKWMDEHNAKTKRISVMAGNDVLRFYEKYGFKVRSHILEQVNSY